jgi:hypothetical protein
MHTFEPGSVSAAQPRTFNGPACQRWSVEGFTHAFRTVRSTPADARLRRHEGNLGRARRRNDAMDHLRRSYAATSTRPSKLNA